ncbi:MAG: hypothetical protein M3552_22000 [Planctomycetota bacterium]|nr:hypothetical protein [Planctomycetaceae bacterium]MDQ3333284.1 hypothetical protein [Planctomycetota bacterium]
MPLAATQIVCLAFAALAAAPVEAPKPDQGVLLQYKFREGETVRYRIEQDATFVASKGPTREKQDTLSRTDQQFKVVAVDADGTATLRMIIAAARMEYGFDDAPPTVYDSSQKDIPAAAFAGVRKAIGRELAELKLHPGGTVDSVRPLLPSEELDAIPGKLGLEGEGPSNLFVAFPERRIKAGETWSDTFSTRVVISGKLTQEVKILRQYRLESVQNGVATIAVKTAPLTVLGDPSLLVQVIQRTTSGTIRFDMQAGRALARKVEFDNMEIGWAGDDSSYRAVSTWTETLLTEPTTVSSR